MSMYDHADEFRNKHHTLARTTVDNDRNNSYASRWRQTNLRHDICQQILMDHNKLVTIITSNNEANDCFRYLINKDWSLVCSKDSSVFLGKLVWLNNAGRNCFSLHPVMEVIHPEKQLPLYYSESFGLRPSIMLLKPDPIININSMLTILNLLMGGGPFIKFRHYPHLYKLCPDIRRGLCIPISDAAAFKCVPLEEGAGRGILDLQMICPPLLAYSWYH